MLNKIMIFFKSYDIKLYWAQTFVTVVYQKWPASLMIYNFSTTHFESISNCIV